MGWVGGLMTGPCGFGQWEPRGRLQIVKLQFLCPSIFLYRARGTASPHPPLAVLAAAAANSLQSCPTLCNPIDGSPPGSSVPGILQAVLGRIFNAVPRSWPGDPYHPWGQPLENSPLIKLAAISCFRGHLLPLTSLTSLVPWGHHQAR